MHQNLVRLISVLSRISKIFQIEVFNANSPIHLEGGGAVFTHSQTAVSLSFFFTKQNI